MLLFRMKKNFSSNLPTDGFLQCQWLHHYFHSKWEWVQLKILEKDLLGRVSKTWLWMQRSGKFCKKMRNEEWTRSQYKQVNYTKVFSFFLHALSILCSCISNILVNIIISSFDMWSVFQKIYQFLLHLWLLVMHI